MMVTNFQQQIFLTIYAQQKTIEEYSYHKKKGREKEKNPSIIPCKANNYMYKKN